MRAPLKIPKKTWDRSLPLGKAFPSVVFSEVFSPFGLLISLSRDLYVFFDREEDGGDYQVDPLIISSGFLLSSKNNFHLHLSTTQHFHWRIRDLNPQSSALEADA